MLRLVLWEQLTHAQAAVVLGCFGQRGGAERLHTARERLRAELAPLASSTTEITIGS